MEFVKTTYLPIHYTEKQLIGTLLADKDNFTSQMMVQVLQNDQAQDPRIFEAMWNDVE